MKKQALIGLLNIIGIQTLLSNTNKVTGENIAHNLDKDTYSLKSKHKR